MPYAAGQKRRSKIRLKTGANSTMRLETGPALDALEPKWLRRSTTGNTQGGNANSPETIAHFRAKREMQLAGKQLHNLAARRKPLPNAHLAENHLHNTISRV